MKKRKITLIIMLVLLFIGLSVLLYPSISTYWNSKTQSQAVHSYENFLKYFSDEDAQKALAAAEEYNAKLRELNFPLRDFRQVEGYNEALNLSGSGMMGYITIDTIGVEIPIYHGTSDSVLAFAAGHIEGTSLPVGGVSTHSALSAHRGLPSAKLFTDLDRIQKGDVFSIKILNKTILYEVDQILTVKPQNTNDLAIVEGKDYCTLVTCTPYGINSHRLLVRGVRTDTVSTRRMYIGSEAYQIDELVVTPIVALPILFVLIMIVVFQPVKTEYFNEGDVFDGIEKKSS
ncbi:MAG: class C sortase [Ruminococcaceae bacterium]|nr:class C sortase [Oscillospiraceae bacterium]